MNTNLKEKMNALRQYIYRVINTKRRYTNRYIENINLLIDQMFIIEDIEERELIINMIKSDNLWEINNYETFIESYSKSTRKSFLTHYSPEYMRNHNIMTFKLKGYNIGFAFAPDENTDEVSIISVHNCSNVHNIGQEILKSAIKHGGTILDRFDGFLSDFYKSIGFEEYGRVKWDDKYAPENWNYEKYGKPDVILRRYKNE